MRRSRVAAGLSALALSASVLAASPAAFADGVDTVSGTVPFACTMPDFGPSADFTYDAEISVKGVRETEDSSPVTLIASMSDMPGVVPAFLSLPNQKVTVELGATAGGTSVLLESSGTTDVNPTNDGTTKDPVKLPENIQGKVETTAATVDVAIKSFAFNVGGVGGSCTADVVLGTVTPALEKAPDPEPEPEPEPSKEPEPSETPDETDDPGDSAGKPAKGTITFACVLSAPFNTPFDYKADIQVSGARATAEDDTVSLSARFSDIPGLAPVPIENGDMEITVKGSVAGSAMTLTGKSVVNVGPNEVVPVPTLKGSVQTDAVEADVELDSFRFEFGEMAGLKISADCDYKSGSLSAMTIGVGDLDEDNDDTNDDTTTTTPPSATLPRTGGGDAMPVIALWAMALGVIGAGALVWLPRRRAEEI